MLFERILLTILMGKIDLKSYVLAFITLLFKPTHHSADHVIALATLHSATPLLRFTKSAFIHSVKLKWSSYWWFSGIKSGTNTSNSKISCTNHRLNVWNFQSASLGGYCFYHVYFILFYSQIIAFNNDKNYNICPFPSCINY